MLPTAKAVGAKDLILPLDIINRHSKVFNLFSVQEGRDICYIAVIGVASFADASFHYNAVTLERKVHRGGECLFEDTFFYRFDAFEALFIADGLRRLYSK